MKLEQTNSQGATSVLYTGSSYNEWGGLASETRALTAQQWQDGVTRNQHTINYTYDDEYKFLAAKMYYQSPGRQLTETYTYDSLGRKVSVTNAEGELSEYLYQDAQHPGNLTALIQHHDDGRVTKKTFDYSGAYHAWATTITDHYTENGSPKTSATHKTYEYIWGNVLTSSGPDPIGTTVYEYDDQGRITQITYPPATGETEQYIIKDNFDYAGSYIFTDPNYPEHYDKVVFKPTHTRPSMERNLG